MKRLKDFLLKRKKVRRLRSLPIDNPPENTKDALHGLPAMIALKSAFEGMELACAFSKSSWDRIKGDGDFATFEKDFKSLYQGIIDLKRILETRKEDLTYMGREIRHLSDDNKLLSITNELPNSLLHHKSQFPLLVQKEILLSRTAEKYIDYFVRLLSSLEARFGDLKNANYQVVEQVHQTVLNAKADRERFLNCLDQLDGAKKELETFGSQIKRLLDEHYASKSGDIKKITGEARHSMHFYVARLEGERLNWQTNGSPRQFEVSSLPEDKVRKIQAIVELCGVLLRLFPDDTATRHLLIRNAVTECREFLLECLRRVSLANDARLADHLARQQISHFLKFSVRTSHEEIFPFFSVLSSGYLASTKRLEDTGQAYAALSGRAEIGAGISKVTFSLVFSFGAESKYGSYGFVVPALEAIENRKFFTRSSTQGLDSFDELHLLDNDYDSSKISSPGAYYQIRNAVVLVPRSDVFNEAALQRLRQTPLIVEGRTFDFTKSWLVSQPDMESRFVFYDYRAYLLSIEGKSLSSAQKFRLFNAFLVSLIGSYRRYSGNIRGKFMVADYIAINSPTYRKDYSGPVFAFVTDPDIKAAIEAEVERKSGLESCLGKLNAVLRSLRNDLSKERTTQSQT